MSGGEECRKRKARGLPAYMNVYMGEITLDNTLKIHIDKC